VVLDTDDLRIRADAIGATATSPVSTLVWDPGLGEGEPVKKGDSVEVGARSVMVLRRVD
jgi:hypothetical protein